MRDIHPGSQMLYNQMRAVMAIIGELKIFVLHNISIEVTGNMVVGLKTDCFDLTGGYSVGITH